MTYGRRLSLRYRSTSRSETVQSRPTFRARSFPLRICTRSVVGETPSRAAASASVSTSGCPRVLAGQALAGEASGLMPCAMHLGVGAADVLTSLLGLCWDGVVDTALTLAEPFEVVSGLVHAPTLNDSVYLVNGYSA